MSDLPDVMWQAAWSGWCWTLGVQPWHVGPPHWVFGVMVRPTPEGSADRARRVLLEAMASVAGRRVREAP